MSFRKNSALHCPFCHHENSHVTDLHISGDGVSIRCRRECPHCGGRFITVGATSLLVKKCFGTIESFPRDKIIAGMARATQGCPVTDSQLVLLARGVEETLRQKGTAVVNAEDAGKAILEPLKVLGKVAYLRFASVYFDFNTLEDFGAVIVSLRHRR